LEHEGQIELTYWAKTKEEAESKAQEWINFSALHNEENVSCGVAEILKFVVPEVSEKGEGH
jgi:hypothetical protein